jgi:hypothetical protein
MLGRISGTKVSPVTPVRISRQRRIRPSASKYLGKNNLVIIGRLGCRSLHCGHCGLTDQSQPARLPVSGSPTPPSWRVVHLLVRALGRLGARWYPEPRTNNLRDANHTGGSACWPFRIGVRRVLCVCGVPGVVTRCCWDAWVAGGGGPGAGRRQRDRWRVLVLDGRGSGAVAGVASYLDAGHAGGSATGTCRWSGTASWSRGRWRQRWRSHRDQVLPGAPRRWRCPDAPGVLGTLVELRVLAPQNPHKSGPQGWLPTESPRTKRHSPAHGGTDAKI